MRIHCNIRFLAESKAADNSPFIISSSSSNSVTLSDFIERVPCSSKQINYEVTFALTINFVSAIFHIS